MDTTTQKTKTNGPTGTAPPRENLGAPGDPPIPEAETVLERFGGLDAWRLCEELGLSVHFTANGGGSAAVHTNGLREVFADAPPPRLGCVQVPLLASEGARLERLERVLAWFVAGAIFFSSWRWTSAPNLGQRTIYDLRLGDSEAACALRRSMRTARPMTSTPVYLGELVHYMQGAEAAARFLARAERVGLGGGELHQSVLAHGLDLVIYEALQDLPPMHVARALVAGCAAVADGRDDELGRTLAAGADALRGLSDGWTDGDATEALTAAGCFIRNRDGDGVTFDADGALVLAEIPGLVHAARKRERHDRVAYHVRVLVGELAELLDGDVVALMTFYNAVRAAVDAPTLAVPELLDAIRARGFHVIEHADLEHATWLEDGTVRYRAGDPRLAEDLAALVVEIDRGDHGAPGENAARV